MKRVWLSGMAMGTAAVVGTGCLKIPTSAEAGISYATTPIDWPTALECIGDTPGMAKEVLVGKTRTVVVAAGDNPISDADWTDFSPGLGNQKNADRNLLFSEGCFWRSPDASADCSGAGCSSIVELKGHTWLELSRVEAADCIPATDKGCDPSAVEPGQLVSVVTTKCHELTFDGEVWYLEGPAGELAVMHATETSTVDPDVRLPSGWTLRAETLTAPLVIHPHGSGDQCYYNILRDEAVQAYHQIRYADTTYP